MEWIKHTSSLF